MDIDDVFLTKWMLASLESVRCWPGACLFYGMALLALGWSCTGLGVTVAVRRVPVLRHSQRTGTQAYFASKVFVVSAGGLGVDSVRDGVLPDPLALSEVVDFPVIMPRQVLAAFAELHGGASDSQHNSTTTPQQHHNITQRNATQHNTTQYTIHHTTTHHTTPHHTTPHHTTPHHTP